MTNKDYDWKSTSFRGKLRFAYVNKPTAFKGSTDPNDQEFCVGIDLDTPESMDLALGFQEANEITAKLIKTHKETGAKYMVFSVKELKANGDKRVIPVTDASGNLETGLLPKGYYIDKGSEVIVHLSTRLKADDSEGRIVQLNSLQAINGITKSQGKNVPAVEGQTIGDVFNSNNNEQLSADVI